MAQISKSKMAVMVEVIWAGWDHRPAQNPPKLQLLRCAKPRGGQQATGSAQVEIGGASVKYQVPTAWTWPELNTGGSEREQGTQSY